MLQLFNFGSWNLHTLLYYQLIPNPFSALNRPWLRSVLQKLLSFFSASPSTVWVDFLFCLKATRGLSPTWQTARFCYLLSVWHLASLSGCFLTEFYFPSATSYRLFSNCPLNSAIFLNVKGFGCIWLGVKTAVHICPVLHFLGPWAQRRHNVCTLPCGALSKHAASNTLLFFFQKKNLQTHFREISKLALAHTFSETGSFSSLFIIAVYLVSDIIQMIESHGKVY